MVTQVSRGGLTSVEQSLVEHILRGEWLDLAADDEAVDEAAMRSWGDTRAIRASVIRDILRGRLAPDLDPHGLRLRGARITGRLDVENLSTDVNFELKDCLLEEGILARDARMATVALDGCQIEHPSEPPLDADRVTCSMLVLTGARIIGHAGRGAVTLSGARIGGRLNCDGANLRNDSGPALLGEALQVDQNMNLSGGFTAAGSGGSGAVTLFGAHIGGRLNCNGANLRNDSGPALLGEALQVDQGMFLTGGLTAACSDSNGAVILTGAHIGGRLDCAGAKLRNDSGAALSAYTLQVDQGMYLRDGFSAAGSDGNGAVILAAAHIGGQLTCHKAELRNDSGAALFAEDLQVNKGMYLTGGFTADGSGAKGAVSLSGAHIGGELNCAGAKVRNDSGPALVGRTLQVDQGMYLTGGFTAADSGGKGAVILTGAHIGGQLNCAGAELCNDSGPALFAEGLQVDQGMYLTGGFTADGSGYAAVDLTSVRVGGTLFFDPELVAHAADSHSRRRIAVDGLTYTGVPELVSVEDWLRLLQDGTPSYAAQPYQQLAAGCRALGHERQAREILIAQRRDQLARTPTDKRERFWGRVTKITLGYGYKPWRALLFLVGTVALSCVLAIMLGAHGALAQTKSTTASGRPCTVIQQFSVGLDLNLPIGTSLARTDCDLTTDPASATAAWLTAASWVLRLLAWAFAALFIAGFTSAVRKT